MDYRELENRLERNQSLIKERAYDRLIQEAKQANKPQRVSWFVSIRLFMASFRRAKVTLPSMALATKQQLEPRYEALSGMGIDGNVSSTSCKN